MEIHQLTSSLSVSPQLDAKDIQQLVDAGFKTVICNRPDQEGEDQPSSDEMRTACESLGIKWYYLPVNPKSLSDQQALQFGQLLDEAPSPVLAYCRTGTRCTKLWALSQAGKTDLEQIIASASSAGYDVTTLSERILALKGTEQDNKNHQQSTAPKSTATPYIRKQVGSHKVLIIGGGAGGQAVAASLLKRKPNLDIGIVEPSSEHHYQPGWTMVGGGIFKASETQRKMIDVMPDRAQWYQTKVTHFEPENNLVVLTDGEIIVYDYLIVAPGLSIDWGAIEGLEAALGRNGVTSNYRHDLAPYTWQLVQSTSSGKAIFTQPPMPIKCAGAPQKAMYLACSEWLDKSRLKNIEVEFCNAGPALFGVAHYVPALMTYIEKYNIQLSFTQNLIKVDGPNQIATFAVKDSEGNTQEIQKPFDMLHVCPVQKPPQFISASPLADASGWLDINPETLQHKKHANIFGIGDVNNTANAKTAAAVRKQAPVIAENLTALLNNQSLTASYDGYGSCPLTVQRGKIVLAEFGYGGKLLPTLPLWLIDGKKPSKLAWLLKEKLLPWIYWNAMLKGREWLVTPNKKTD